MIGDLYLGQRRTEALGYNSSVLSVGTASYPAIGGALALLGWRYPFALPLVAIPVALLVLFSLRNPESHNDQDLKEYAGNVWASVRDWRVVGLFCSTLITFVILFGPLISYLPIFMSATFPRSSRSSTRPLLTRTGVPLSPSTALSCASAKPSDRCSCPPPPFRSGSAAPTSPEPPSPPRCSSWP